MYIVIDKYGNPWGPFESANVAATWAVKKWPDQSESPEIESAHFGQEGATVTREGWSVWALLSPDDLAEKG